MEPSNNVTPIIDGRAIRINEAHRKFQQSMNSSLAHAIEIGRLLLEEKAEQKHGVWLPWISQNCEFSVNLADRYMRCAKKASELANYASMHNLNFSDALKALAKPRSETPRLPAGNSTAAHPKPAPQPDPTPAQTPEPEPAPDDDGENWQEAAPQSAPDDPSPSISSRTKPPAPSPAPQDPTLSRPIHERAWAALNELSALDGFEESPAETAAYIVEHGLREEAEAIIESTFEFLTALNEAVTDYMDNAPSPAAEPVTTADGEPF